jgi:hypothetical protein
MNATILRAGWLSALAMFFAPLARADAPAFDRPGISFSTSVLPAGSFDWEQGLPDMERDHGDGVWTTTQSAGTNFRFGLGNDLEMQLSSSLWNRLDQHDAVSSSRLTGVGDTKVSLKWAPSLASKDWSLAVLGGVSFDTGTAAFSNGQQVTSLGATVARDLGGNRSFAAYANVDHSGGADTWTLSTNYGFPLAGNFAGYVEAGRSFGTGTPASVAGGGVTWLFHDRLQLDVYARCGLTAESPDLQAGTGISLYWP